jgi:Protein of unknown function (DUF3300)
MRKPFWMRAVSLVIAFLLTIPLPVLAQNNDYPSPEQAPPSQKQFSREELAQLVAPIALYPDELVAQVLMASTYPLEIVEADRWVQQNKGLKGDPLAKNLEQKNWDPSVKSLVNFPSVLSMMSQKLEVTAKLGDAFLNQEKDLMDTVQDLRKRAYDAGNLTGNQEQKVVMEKETIIIQPANPQVIYVPTYNPTVVYGGWMYPAYPPYPYYAYPPPAYGAFAFGMGITIGLAWGYAWGGCNWHGSSVNVNVWRNTTINNTYINRNNYQRNYQNRGMVGENGQGTWHHDSTHRKGVAYRDQATARKYGQSPARPIQAGRDARGYGDKRGMGGTSPNSTATTGQAPRGGGTPGITSRAPGQPPAADKGSTNRTGTAGSGGNYPARSSREITTGASQPANGRANAPTGGSHSYGDVHSSGKGDSAFSRSYGDGASTRADSNRGKNSRQSSGGTGPGNSGGTPLSGGAPRSGGGPGGSGGGAHGGGGTQGGGSRR